MLPSKGYVLDGTFKYNAEGQGLFLQGDASCLSHLSLASVSLSARVTANCIVSFTALFCCDLPYIEYRAYSVLHRGYVNMTAGSNCTEYRIVGCGRGAVSI